MVFLGFMIVKDFISNTHVDFQIPFKNISNFSSEKIISLLEIFLKTEIKNAELQATAEYISKNIAKNYRYEMGKEVIESGLDNYKSIEIYYEKDVELKPVK